MSRMPQMPQMSEGPGMHRQMRGHGQAGGAR